MAKRTTTKVPKKTTTTIPKKTVSKKANLARIRDNQRRSRVRRKAYLQELETKWRRCEQMGIEASTEMQLAARKVLDENKKLRILLNQKGVSNEEIDAMFTTSSTPSPTPHDINSPLPNDTLTKLLSITHTPLPMSHPAPQLLTPPSLGSVASLATTPIKCETFPVIYAPSRGPDEQSRDSFEYELYTPSIDPSCLPDQNMGYPGYSYTSCGDVTDIPSMNDPAVKLENAMIPATDFQVDNTNAFTSLTCSFYIPYQDDILYATDK